MGKRGLQVFVEGTHYLSNKTVTVHNALVRAAQGLSLVEKRIVFAGIAQSLGRNAFVTVTAQEYADTYGVNLKTAYNQLKEGIDSIFKRYVAWAEKDINGKLFGIKYHWVEGYRYVESEGRIEFKFTSLIQPYLFDLQREFTTYRLSQAGGLRSLYSWRLLEFLEHMRKKQSDLSPHDFLNRARQLFNKEPDANTLDSWLLVSIEEFWHAMEVPEVYKKNFNLLRTKIIQPAVNELIASGEWVIFWDFYKRGRRVAVLRFDYKKNLQQKLF